MNIFRYSKDWADLIVAQLASLRQTRYVGLWGYGCLVIGKEFEGVIERNWFAVDRITGPHLHIFTLMPPPKDFVQERLNEFRLKPSTPDTELAIHKYMSILQSYDEDRSILVREKVNLLSDLKEAGLEPDQYADFLFFQFRNEGYDVEIDIVAAKSAGIPTAADDRDYLKCLERMTKVASKHYSRNSKTPVAVVVKDMTFLWDVRVAIEKISGLATYIRGFLRNLKGEG